MVLRRVHIVSSPTAAAAEIGPARLGPFVAVSSPMREFLEQLRAVADSDLPVLIEGGPGVGKSLAAATLHGLGPWRGRPLLELDATVSPVAFDEGLARVREATHRSRAALVLDSIEVLSADRQRSLVRLLDDLGVGEDLGDRPNLRLITTSRRELKTEVLRGRFRADLYYRLRGVLLAMPSLAERHGDLPLLIDQIVGELAAKAGVEPIVVSPVARERLAAQAFAGNVRDLVECLRLALAACVGGRIEAYHFDDLDRGTPERAGAECDLRAFRHVHERALVLEALESVRWNVSAAARGLGLSRVGLCKKMKVLGLARPEAGRRGAAEGSPEAPAH